MKIYEVTKKLTGSSFVLVAKNESKAIEMVANYLNKSSQFHFYETSDFRVRTIIDADKFNDEI